MDGFSRKLFLALLFSLFVNLASQSLAEIFSQIKAVNERDYPSRFSCSLKSTIINLQLKNIPPEMIEFNQKPELLLSLTKKKSPKLKLKGVLPFYQNYFLPYEDFIARSGLFIGVDNYSDFKSLEKEFSVKIASQNRDQKQSFRILLSEKGGLPGDYGEYFFNEEKKLTKSVYYENNRESVNLTFFYQKIKDHVIPKRIIVRVLNPNKLDQIKSVSEYFIDFRKCFSK